MALDKLKKIESLSNEITDFQPVLFELFKKLPGVTSVECKQGPNEKGADFVIVKIDPTLGDETYIGVICKVGKITQNHSEVERQVDECVIYPRLILSGKKSIHLNEIWVVNNSTISTNAEEKINIKNKNTNIRFLNGQKVCELIDRHYPQFWSFSSVSYGQYFSDLELKIATVKESTFFGILNSSSFIERRVIKEQVKRNKVRPEPLNNALSREKYTFLEGNVGSGKSTLIKQLIENQKSSISLDEESGLLPVIFHYSEVYLEPFKIVDMAEAVIKRFNLPADRNIIIVIDGIDEIKQDFIDRVEALRLVVNAISDRDNIKLLVTSRTMDSLQDYDALDKLFTRYSIVPLSIKQIINFVDLICSNETITKKLTTGIEKTHLFKFIPRTPISAILLARILTDEIKELPSTMTELYAKYTEIVLGRWDTSKGLMSQTEYEIIHSVLMDVAEFMMVNSLPCISQSELETYFLDYTVKRNISIDIDKVFERLCQRSEVASTNAKNNTFSFVHRTFMEYFYAEKMKKKGSLNLDEKIYDMYWSNTYFFLLGLIRDSEQLIEQINNLVPKENVHRFTRLFVNGNFYLAAYLTPYDKISSGVKKTFYEAGELYNDVISIDSKTPLREFSPIALMCIMTKSLYNNFSYEYFTKALYEAADEINKTINPTPSQKYSLFFISATLLELGDESSFDKLVLNLDPDIFIQLGITHAVSERGLLSSTVEKYMKKLKKRYSGNHNMQHYIIELHETPIEDIKKLN